MNVESRSGEPKFHRFVAPLSPQTFELLQFTAPIAGYNTTDTYNRAIQCFAFWKGESVIGHAIDEPVGLFYGDSEDKEEPKPIELRQIVDLSERVASVSVKITDKTAKDLSFLGGLMNTPPEEQVDPAIQFYAQLMEHSFNGDKILLKKGDRFERLIMRPEDKPDKNK